MRRPRKSLATRLTVVAALISMLPTAIGWWYYIPKATAQTTSPQADASSITTEPSGISAHSDNFSDKQTVKQDHDEAESGQLSCGPCALYNLLGDRGITSTVYELSVLSESKQSGTTMLGLRNAARIKGLDVTGVIARKLDELEPPFIAFVNENHFTYVKSVNADSVEVQDDLGKSREISHKQFNDQWSGEALILADNSKGVAETLPDEILSAIRGTATVYQVTGFPPGWCDDHHPRHLHFPVGTAAVGADAGGDGICDCDSSWILNTTIHALDSNGNHGHGFLCVSPRDSYPPDLNQDGDIDSCGAANAAPGCGDVAATPATMAVPVQTGPGQPASGLHNAPRSIQTNVNLPNSRVSINTDLSGLSIAQNDVSTESSGDLLLNFTRESHTLEGLSRDYRSGLGTSWTHNFNRSLESYVDSYHSPTTSNTLFLRGTSGIPTTYIRDSVDANLFRATGADSGSVIRVIGGEYVFIYGNGTKYGFGTLATGQISNLKWVEDADGKRLSLVYDSENKLTRVNTPSNDGRYLLFEYNESLDLITKTSLKKADNSTVTYTEYTYEAIADRKPLRDNLSSPDETVYASSGFIEYVDGSLPKPASSASGFSRPGPTPGNVYHLKTIRKDGLTDSAGQPIVVEYTYFRHALQLAVGTSGGWFKAIGDHAARFGLNNLWIKETQYEGYNPDTGALEPAAARQIINVYHLSSIKDQNGNVYSIDHDYPVEPIDTSPPIVAYPAIWKGDVGITITSPNGLQTKYSFDKTANTTVVQNINSSSGQVLSQITYKETAESTTAAQFWPLGQTTGSMSQWSYLMNESGLQSVTAPSGSGPYMSLTYDSSDRLSTVRSGSSTSNVKWTWTYDATHESPTKVEDPTGVADIFTIGSNERLQNYRPASANQTSGTTFNYAQGQLSSIVDTNNVTWTFLRDSKDRITKVQYPDGAATRERSITYNDLNQVTSFTDEAGSVTTYHYADPAEALTNRVPAGTLLYVTNAGNIPTYFQYNKSVQLTKIIPYKNTIATDPGPVTKYTYDSMNRVSTIVVPDGSPDARTTTFQYNLLGKLTKIIDPKGNQTSYEYDEMGRTTKIDDAVSSNDVSYAYYPIGTLSKITVNKNGTSQIWNYTYDPVHHRLSTVTSPTGKVLTYNYDLAGRTTKIFAGAGGAANEFIYAFETNDYTGTPNHKRGLLKEYKYPTDFGGTFVQTYDYDTQGRTAEIHDPTESFLDTWVGPTHGVQYAYDALDRLTAITKYDLPESSFGYNMGARQQSITDAMGRTQTYTFDNRYRLTTLAAPGTNKTWTFHYNTLNQLTSYDVPDYATLGLGTNISYLFDADDLMLDQISATKYVGNTYGIWNTYNYLYDNNRNITKIIESDGTNWTYTYDSRNRVSTAVRTEASNVAAYYAFYYDTADNLTTIGMPFEDDFNDRTITDDGWSSSGTWTWDDTNSVSEARSSSTGGATLSRANSDASLDIQLTYTNHNISVPDNRLQVVYRIASGSFEWLDIYADRMVLRNYPSQQTYFFTNNNVPVTQNRPYRIRLLASGTSIKVWRDNVLVLNTTNSPNLSTSLLQFNVTANADIGIDDLQVTADGLASSRSFTYNNDNSLATYADFNGTTSFSYDDWGRPYLQRRTIGAVNQDVTHMYGIDGKVTWTDGRTWPDFGKQIAYNHSGDGKPRSRNIFDGNVFAGDATEYRYGAGFDVLNEIHGTDVKTYIAGLAEAKGTTSSLGTYRYLVNDHLGSPRMVTNESESMSLDAQFDYSPFGAPYFAQEASFGAGTTDPGHITHRFTGHDYDLRGGFYNTAYRRYSPTTGRWLQPDPLGMVNGPNVYAYVGDNPISYTDPLGLWGVAFGNDSGTKRYFQIGWGDPWIHLSVRNQFEATAQGLMAFADGVIPFGDPFESLGGYDPCMYGLSLSRGIGSTARDVELLLAGGYLPRLAFLAPGRSIFFTGGADGMEAALALARGGAGTTIQNTAGGKFLQWAIGNKPSVAWDWASKLYAQNAGNSALIVVGSNGIRAASTYARVESGILKANQVSKYYYFLP